MADEGDGERKATLTERLARTAILVAGRLTRSMLLGVRGVVVDPHHRVLLVRHTYVKGWHFPGGGVEIGETLLQSLERELREEANVVPTAPPGLHGVFFNPKLGRRDHVAVYVVREYRVTGPRTPDREIAECASFAIDALPEDTARPVRERLAEIFEARPVRPFW